MSTCMVYDRATHAGRDRRDPPDQARLAVRRVEDRRRGADAVLLPRLRPADDGRPPVQHLRPVPALGRGGRGRRHLHPPLAARARSCGSTATGPRRATSCTSRTAPRFVVRRADLRCGDRPASSTPGPGADVSVNELAGLIEPDPARIVHVPHIHPQSEIAVLRCDSRKAARAPGLGPGGRRSRRASPACGPGWPNDCPLGLPVA